MDRRLARSDFPKTQGTRNRRQHAGGFRGSRPRRKGIRLFTWWLSSAQVCDELVQNIDLVPTYFELAEAKKPDAYHIDGTSLTPLFKNGKVNGWRDHVYLEMGAARAAVTKDWSYIAVRHTKEQVEAIQASPQKLAKRRSHLVGRLGIESRGQTTEFLMKISCTTRDGQKEMQNLAHDERHADRLQEMNFMQQDLEAIGRPFGEFIPGLNTSPSGQINEQLALVKQIEIKGKNLCSRDVTRQSQRDGGA